MDDDEKQDPPARPEERPAQPDERSVELSEDLRKGVDVRPTSDPQAVNLPPMGGPAPVEAAPAVDQGGFEDPGTDGGEPAAPGGSGSSDVEE
jgi:hypothetical protein